MRWTPGSGNNVEDVRGRSAGGFGIPMGIGGVLVLLVGSWLTGVDLFSLFGSGTTTAPSSSVSSPASSSPQEQELMTFVDAVTGDIQNSWQQRLGARYQPTKVRVFRDAVQSACGMSESATGPFYCPGDQRVYLDLGFFDELARRFHAPGDFAQAYVIAHEIGHHIQNLTGTIDREPFNGNANARSVRVELQADCYAGVWGHDAAQPGRAATGRVELDPGDVEEALAAASAIGDDRLQQASVGRVMPDKFTHGSSAQRVSWFKKGMETGDPAACNTFAN
jgi:predicted metalloprotease